MTILFINFEYPPLGGGGGVMTADLARELAKRHAVHVLTTRYGDLPRYEVVDNVHVHRVAVIGRTSLPTATLLSLLAFAVSAFFVGLIKVRKYNFDIICAHFVVPSGVPALLLAKMFRIPLVVTLVGGDIYDPSKIISPHKHFLLRAIIRFITRNADEVTAISQDTKQRAIELHGVSSAIDVIPIGLVPNTTPAISREELGFASDAMLCVSIGRLVPRKGYETLLTAFKGTAGANLVIIGDGPLKHELQNLIEKHNLTNRIRLAGSVSEEQKFAILRAGDIYVSAAQHEGFGIVFLEAMSAGLPIVCANDGGQKDFLQQGVNALLVPAHDAQKITDAVTGLMKNASMRQTMAERNKKDVQRYYIEQTAQLLEHVLHTTKARYEHHS